MTVSRVQMRRHLHGNKRGRIASRSAHAEGGSSLGSSSYDGNPYGDRVVARLKIQEALDPSRAPGKVRRFADMTPQEQADLRAKYEGGP